MAQGTLQRRDDRMEALVDQVSELASMDGPRKRLAGLHSGLDIITTSARNTRCSAAACPISTSVTSGGPVRAVSLLHDARPVLLNLAPARRLGTSLHGRIGSRLIDAEDVGVWELPVIGEVAVPVAVLIRPDGYVAWVGDGTDLGLAEALTTWFGPPRATGVDRVTLGPT